MKISVARRRAIRLGSRRFISSENTIVSAVFSALFFMSGSSSPAIDAGRNAPHNHGTPPTQLGRNAEVVIVMTWDGVRWQEILKGVDSRLARSGHGTEFKVGSPAELLPNLYRLANNGGVLLGADGARVMASSPSTLSLPGYSEILSGRTPTCTDNECGPTDAETLLDHWHGARPDARLAVISSWDKIPRVAAKNTASIDISAGRLFVNRKDSFCTDAHLCTLVENAKDLAPWPGIEEYRPDGATAAIALSYLRAKKPNFAFIGLGDTDEHAHHGNYAGYLAALHKADATLGAVQQWLSEQEHKGTRTLLVVTADHGRSSNFAEHTRSPEAARVWALVSGSGFTARRRPITTRNRLADIAPTIREFVRLKRDDAPAAGTSWAIAAR